MTTYLRDESNRLVVPLEYSKNMSEVRLQEPLGRHLKLIQRSVKQHKAKYGDVDEITLVQIAVAALADPKVTIQQLDECDALDIYTLGEGLASFPFFAKVIASGQLGTPV